MESAAVKYLVCLFFLLFTLGLAARQIPADTAVQRLPPRSLINDTAAAVSAPPRVNAVMENDTLARVFYAHGPGFGYRDLLKNNDWFNWFGQPENRVAKERQASGKETMFYLLAGLLFFFAVVKLLFNKYVNNLLGLVFRGSLRQKQIREQLLQTPLPSLCLNIFFVAVAGLYIFFLLHYYGIGAGTPFWLQLLYCTGSVGLVYLVKFIILKLTGWIFNMRDAADTYIFIVFLVNKLMAIFLLPLLIMMSFCLASWTSSLLTLSYVLVGVLFAYRYMVSFAPVRREVKVSQFHFFMYLCAFEVIPLLLIYKILIHFF